MGSNHRQAGQEPAASTTELRVPGHYRPWGHRPTRRRGRPRQPEVRGVRPPEWAVRFFVRGLDDGFPYPCTKTDVREAFGNGLLDSASLGGSVQVDRFFYRGDARREITGRVILKASVSHGSWYAEEAPRCRASITAYRVRKSEWSDPLHGQVRVAMRERLRPWVDGVFARPETGLRGQEETLVEPREGAPR